MLRERDALDPARAAAAAAALAGIVPPLLPAGAAVAAFWPMGSEVDTRPLLRALYAAGHALLLPDTPPRGMPLRFRRWVPGAAMRPGRFGTAVPEGEEGVPGVLLVPLLAFDRRCRRLGYGGGYYDRTLAELPGARAMGLAFAAQEVDEVPVLPHDAPLDAVATERGVVRRADQREP